MQDLGPIELEVLLKDERFQSAVEDIYQKMQRLDNASQRSSKTFNASMVDRAKSTQILNNSINQISREMPAFTYSVQTGFMAISNNIPLLADSIKRLREENELLKSSGQKTVPVWKQLATSLFSWQTLLSVGITLLTVYGKEIDNWATSLFKGKEAVDKLINSYDSLQKGLEDSSYKNAVKDVTRLTTVIDLAKRGFISKKYAVDEYNKSIGKATGSVKNLLEAEKQLEKNKDAYMQMMLYKAAANVSLEESAKVLAENTKKRQELEQKLAIAESKYYSVKSAKPATTIKLDRHGMPIETREDKAIINVEKAKKEVEDVKAEIKSLKDSSNKVFSDLFNEAAKIAKDNGFNLVEEVEIKEKDSKKIISNYQNLLEKIAELDAEYQNRKYNENEKELQDLKDKFSAIRKEVQKFNASQTKIKIPLAGLNELEKKSIITLKYRQETEALTKELEKRKADYQAFEKFATETSKEEAEKRFGEMKDFAVQLQEEINKVSVSPQIHTPEGAERLEKLTQTQGAYEVEIKLDANEKFSEAYQAYQSFIDQKRKLDKDYQKSKIQLEKITDDAIRAEKLKSLNQEHQERLDALNAEAFAKTEVYKNINRQLVIYSKKEIENQIKTIEEFLAKAKNLTPEQKTKIENQLADTKSKLGKNDRDTAIKQLLKDEAKLEKAITDERAKGNNQVAELLALLQQVKAELEFQEETAGILKFAENANIAASAFRQLSNDIAGLDEDLADSLNIMGEMADVAASTATAIASGNPIQMGAAALNVFGFFASQQAKVRESERKAREELAKFEQDAFAAQLAYNAEIRKRIQDEVKLNDLYQSRVENIKEELSANRKSAKNVQENIEIVTKRLLDAKTIVAKETYKSGGFLGLWKKTKVRDVEKSVAEILGLGHYVDKKMQKGFLSFMGKEFIADKDVKITDELLDKLEKINGQTPLANDAKTAFEQLKKLRDEYGSLANAEREFEKQLKDASTGTTAQSIAESIKQGIASGKKSFADFADDIEGFLRQGILAGMSARAIEPQIQKLQDELYNFLGDDILTQDEKNQFQEMYMKVVNEAKSFAEMMNQAGIDMNPSHSENTLKGAMNRMTEQQADLLAGQFGGLRLAQLETNQISKHGFAQMMESNGKMIALQMELVANTKKTAENTGISNKYLKEIATKIKSNGNDKRASGFM